MIKIGKAPLKATNYRLTNLVATTLKR